MITFLFLVQLFHRSHIMVTDLQAMKQKPRIRRKQLNTLLGYTVNRLKQKVSLLNFTPK